MIDNLSLQEIKVKLNNSSPLKDLLPLEINRKAKLDDTRKSIEETLISKLSAGDYSVFSCIFTTYYKDLVVFALQYTRDFNNAEEIVQDTFVKLWEDRASINIKKSLRSFLLKSVQNRCIDWLRHSKTKQAHYRFIIESAVSYDHDTENYILYSELHREVEKALKMLPLQVSKAFRMNRYQGLKYHEIAGILNVSLRTVEVRIGKALSLLRNYLKEYMILIAGIACLLI
ncbi:MAG: RNA polymerase sigma-70 factor [Bacteroidales bacterium]